MSSVDSVLLVVPRWVRDGGVVAHIGASAQALAARGTRVSILAAKIEWDFVPTGAKIFCSPGLYNREAPLEARIGEALELEPSLIHLNQLGDAGVVEFLRRRAPVVMSAHAFVACTSSVHYFKPGQECLRAHGPGCILNLPRCAHTRNPFSLPSLYALAGRELSALLRADVAVSYSSAVDRHLAINGVARRRVVPYFPTVAPAVPSERAGGRRVVFAGRIVAPKGVATLVRAAREVDGEFIVCGDGWQLPAMRRLAERLGVAERVHFAGWLDPGALAQEFADAAIVAVPSLWPEPFGIIGIEGFAAGRPVVASDTGGIGDWLEHQVSGLMVPAGDARALALALTELLDDPGRREEMGAAGKRRLQEHFTVEHHLAAITEAYAAARDTWSAGRGGQSPARTSMSAAR
ncbi:MAG TPA: glycosyltransferase family 4 protein [Solirubrobacteraceae bacterium]|nr:glycosyltransferase family 4 protein [Solirubrobacteraceae bacterium]